MIDRPIADLNGHHLGLEVTIRKFLRADVEHDISGTLTDVHHLSAGRMTIVTLENWTATPPLAPWVSPHGGWMCRSEMNIEVPS